MRSILPWVVVAFLVYLVVVLITVAVNVPFNDGIKAAGAPDRTADVTKVRKAPLARTVATLPVRHPAGRCEAQAGRVWHGLPSASTAVWYPREVESMNPAQ